jgi:hypothetical protein
MQSGRSNKLFYTCKLDSFSIARAGNGPPKMSGGSRGCTKIIFIVILIIYFLGGRVANAFISVYKLQKRCWLHKSKCTTVFLSFRKKNLHPGGIQIGIFCSVHLDSLCIGPLDHSRGCRQILHTYDHCFYTIHKYCTLGTNKP